MLDGDAFWETMQKAADLTTDVPTKGEIYSELALETTGRPGM